MGGDTPFRWDFLARQILAFGKFDFYPPLTPADFRTYFFVDGIPPLVSFTHWWLYASAGQIPAFPHLRFRCRPVRLHAGIHLRGRFCRLFAARRAFCRSHAGRLPALLSVRRHRTGDGTHRAFHCGDDLLRRHRPSARRSSGDGVRRTAAALCALSREYGWIALIAGAIALLWRRHPLKQVIVFGAVATAAAAPWYVRNWMLTGNPFYSLKFLSFAVNPVHDSIMRYYSASLGVAHWTASNWASLFFLLLVFATFQLLAGIPGGFARLRSHGYLLVIALLLIGVWILSAGYTSGGVLASTRVLSPALVVLSITAAGILEPLTHRAPWRTAIGIAIAAGLIWTAAQGAIYPKDPFSLPPGQWLANAFPHIDQPAEFQIRDQLVRLLPAGYRVLSDSAYLHAALAGTGIDVVPVWSPEVRFIFSTTPDEAERQLRALRIRSVVVYPLTMNMTYLTAVSPFYAALPERWRPLAQVGDFLFVLGPKDP